MSLAQAANREPLFGNGRGLALARQVRAGARLASALILLLFVVCHLTSHMFLLVSLPAADEMLARLMGFWWTNTGGLILLAALAVHVINALWAIFIRRYLRMSLWEWMQIALGLAILPMLVAHVIGTRVADQFLGSVNGYHSVLVRHWVVAPWMAWMQTAAVLVLWLHACIGIHFWLRTKRWYPAWLPAIAVVGLLIPTLALAGYVAGGNQILREAIGADYVDKTFRDAHVTPEIVAATYQLVGITWTVYIALVLLPFAGRGVRAVIYRLHRPPLLTHAGGRTLQILPGATVLETLRAAGIPHASVCGGRARCTTCRIRVVEGIERLPPPAGLEARALGRIHAPDGLRLACQIRPTADITVLPLLAAEAGASDGLIKGGMEGSERAITVVFVDLRGSTALGEARMPYDVLFLLNQFFGEMTKALASTGGHYSNFTGDGLMAIYGLDAPDPTVGPAQALRGAREMLRRLDVLNAQLGDELRQPLRIGIGIHYGEAIVGAMGPPRSQIITAIGDTVNTAARLESLTKDYNCSLVISRRAAEAAAVDLRAAALHTAPVKGREQPVEFYALDSVPEPARS
jgi:adenylate cyclase